MRTRSSSNLPIDSSPNLTTSNPKRRNRRRSKQPFILEESPVDTMADQRIMMKLLRAPTEGYAEEIVVPPILAEQFELKHSLINMMASDQFFGLEKDNPHDHIRCSNKTHLQPRLRLLRKSVLPMEVLIRTTSVLPPVATLSQNTGITFKVTFQQPQMNTASTSGSGTLPGNTIANPKGELKPLLLEVDLLLKDLPFPILPNPSIQRRMNV
nr:reverse transcriptase domain-containing protein [Tanacetum cinerariifolium]